MSMLQIKSLLEIYGYGRKNSLLIDTDHMASSAIGEQPPSVGLLREGAWRRTYGTGSYARTRAPSRLLRQQPAPPRWPKIGDQPAVPYRGSIAVAGSAGQWLRDNLGMIVLGHRRSGQDGRDNGGVCIVPRWLLLCVG